MRFEALATDYDGTIAHHGVVDQATTDALLKAKGAGLRLILVTGRELSDLFNTFAHSTSLTASLRRTAAFCTTRRHRDPRSSARPRRPH